MKACIMESQLETEFNDILKQDNVTGCVIADPQGLCLMTSPNIKVEMAGLIAALAQHAGLIEPNSGCHPVVLLESDSRQCLVHKDGGITTGIFKDLSSKQIKM